jgi:hypothetical protein
MHVLQAYLRLWAVFLQQGVWCAWIPFFVRMSVIFRLFVAREWEGRARITQVSLYITDICTTIEAIAHRATR